MLYEPTLAMYTGASLNNYEFAFILCHIVRGRLGDSHHTLAIVEGTHSPEEQNDLDCFLCAPTPTVLFLLLAPGHPPKARPMLPPKAQARTTGHGTAQVSLK